MRRGHVRLLVMASWSALACAHAPVRATPAEPTPRPNRGRLGTAVASNATCVSCHPREASEWSGSLHRRADTNAPYRAAFELEPLPFCRACHVPEADPAVAPPAAVSELGVGCVTCHVTDGGAVLAAETAPAPTGATGAAHPVERSAELTGSAACARCHEFAFPSPDEGGDGAFMQTTVREHERSPTEATACAGCHMARREGGRSHAFAEVRDTAWLRSKLRATAAEGPRGELHVTLTQTDPGHAFPTGDLFRRLEVGCEAREADGRAGARDVRYLARHFELQPYRAGRTLVRDDRVLDEPVVVALRCARTPPGEVSWWVSYQRVATLGAGRDPATARVESEVRLHAGTLPAKEVREP